MRKSAFSVHAESKPDQVETKPRNKKMSEQESNAGRNSDKNKKKLTC